MYMTPSLLDIRVLADTTYQEVHVIVIILQQQTTIVMGVGHSLVQHVLRVMVQPVLPIIIVHLEVH
jgi:hypothetical protein